MTDKYIILDNVEEYTAEQLVEFIHKGIITYIELKTETNGQFDARKRKQVKKLLENGDQDAWEKVKQEGTLEAVQHYLDIYPNGEFREEAINFKMEIQIQIDHEENATAADREWESVDKNSIKELQAFNKKNPNSQYQYEANTLLEKLYTHEVMGFGTDSLVSKIKKYQTEGGELKTIDDNIIKEIKTYLEEKIISKDEFLRIIKEDTNLLSAGIIKRIVSDKKDKVISLKDLVGIEIDKLFIQKMLMGENPQIFNSPQKLDRIHKPSTEVYFWGIPSSGKSCALGAILTAAANGKGAAKSMDPDIHSQGHGYMNQLKKLFKDGKVSTLMEGTSIDAFYEMGFDLIDEKDNRYPFTFIDMAGELMRCMYKENAKEPLDATQTEMLDTLTNVLIDNRSRSRKMHIFVIEYGAEDKLYEGMPQDIFLEGAASYIKNTGIFKKETDAIFIMITKIDKAKDTSKDALNKYVNDNYLGFYNALELICKENEINRGRVEKINFSLGEVCFQNYCRFDARAAENVVDILLQRSRSFRGGKIGNIIKNLGK